MNFEFRPEEAMEAMEEMEQTRQQMEMDPPKLERTEASKEKSEEPPKLERSTSLGESREAFNKRKALESSTNRIQAEHRARDYAKQLAEDARKEQEYREKLYGK